MTAEDAARKFEEETGLTRERLLQGGLRLVMEPCPCGGRGTMGCNGFLSKVVPA